MSLVPKHIKALKPYVAGKSKKEFKRKFGNKEPIKLASNENPLGCSPKSIDKLDNHINNCNRYPDSSGFELRKKLADIYDLDMNNVIIGSGSEGIMSNVMRTFLSGNDKIIGIMLESNINPGNQTLGKNIENLLSAISWIYTHGNSDSGKSFDELNQKAMQSKIYGLCDTISIWLLDTLREQNISSRLGDFVRTNSESILGIKLKKHPNVDFSKGIAISAGFNNPSTLEEWSQFNRQQLLTPWVANNQEILDLAEFARVTSRLVDGKRLPRRLDHALGGMSGLDESHFKDLSRIVRKAWREGDFSNLEIFNTLGNLFLSLLFNKLSGGKIFLKILS